MPTTAGSLSGRFAGSSPATEVLAQVRPFQCATLVPAKAQMLLPDSPLPPSRPRPDRTRDHTWPLKCQAPSPLPGTKGWPNTQTLLGLMTTPPPICAGKDFSADQWLPFQRSARDVAPPPVNAHTLVADDAPAATTSSPFWPGNGTFVQDGPLRFQAVGRVIP